MSRKVVDLTIRLKDGVSGVLGKMRTGIGRVGTAFKSMAKVGVWAFGGLAAAATSLGFAVKKAFDFETAKIQLKTLLGSMAAATKRFNELKEFSAKTPFQLPDLLKASRLLTTFSEGALGSAESLQAIGDAAAGVNENISDVSFWIGRAYSMLKGGKPFGEAAMRLQEMGILTASGRQELEDLQKSGADFTIVWERLQKELLRFEGGMKALSQTGNGLLSTLKDNWTIAVATFGEAFMDAAKGGIQTMINTIQKLVKDGTITEWANQAKAALDSIAQVIKIISKGGEGSAAVLKAVGNVIKQAFKSAATTAIEVLAKYAPSIGKAIASGVMDLLGIKTKAVRQQQGRASDASTAYANELRFGTKTSQKATYDKLQEELKKLKDIKDSEGSVTIEGTDSLQGSIDDLKAVLDKFDDKGIYLNPSDGPGGLSGAVESATKKGTEKGVKAAMTIANSLRNGLNQKLTGSIYEDDDKKKKEEGGKKETEPFRHYKNPETGNLDPFTQPRIGNLSMGGISTAGIPLDGVNKGLSDSDYLRQIADNTKGGLL